MASSQTFRRKGILEHGGESPIEFEHIQFSILEPLTATWFAVVSDKQSHSLPKSVEFDSPAIPIVADTGGKEGSLHLSPSVSVSVSMRVHWLHLVVG